MVRVVRMVRTVQKVRMLIYVKILSMQKTCQTYRKKLMRQAIKKRAKVYGSREKNEKK